MNRRIRYPNPRTGKLIDRTVDEGPGPVGMSKPRVLGGVLLSNGSTVHRNTNLALPSLGTTAVEWNKGPSSAWNPKNGKAA